CPLLRIKRVIGRSTQCLYDVIGFHIGYRGVALENIEQTRYVRAFGMHHVQVQTLAQTTEIIGIRPCAQALQNNRSRVAQSDQHLMSFNLMALMGFGILRESTAGAEEK